MCIHTVCAYVCVFVCVHVCVCTMSVCVCARAEVRACAEFSARCSYAITTTLKHHDNPFQVFMLSTDDVLNERMLRAVVESGHSRVPIHKAGDKTDLVGGGVGVRRMCAV